MISKVGHEKDNVLDDYVRFWVIAKLTFKKKMEDFYASIPVD